MKLFKRILNGSKFIVILLTIVLLSNNVIAEVVNSINITDFEEKITQSWRYREYNLSFNRPDLEIWDLIETPDSTIWAVTNYGFAYFDKFKWVMTNYKFEHIHRLGGFSFNDLSIAAGNKDELYYIEENKLFRIDKQTKKRIPIIYKDLELELCDIVRYEDSFVIMSKNNDKNSCNIFLLDKNHFLHKIKLPNEFNDYTEYNLARTSDKSLWLNSDKGLFLFKNSIWQKVIETNYILDLSKIIKFKEDYYIFIDYPFKYQGIWKYDKTITRLDSSMMGFKSVDNCGNNVLLTVLYNGYSSIYDDKWYYFEKAPGFIKSSKMILFSQSGDLWSFKGNRITRVLLSSDLWEYWDYSNDFKSKFINDIIKSKDGYIWIATGYGVEKSKEAKLIRKWSGTGDTKFLAVTGIIEDKYGRKWIGSGSHFTNPYYFSNNKWNKFEILPDNKNIFVHKIRKDRRGRLWFLTISNLPGIDGYGAVCYDFDSLIFWDKSKGLLANRVYDFVEDSSGGLWFATSKGLCRFKDNKWTYWSKKDGLLSERIFALELHPNGKILYFSSRDIGGFGYVKNDSILLKYNNNNYNKIIARDFVFDNYGKLWISTTEGLYCEIGNYLIRITEQEGLINERCWPLLNDNEHLYVGTTGSGINVLHYSDIEEIPPEVEIYHNLRENDLSFELKVYSYNSFFDNNSYYLKYQIDDGQWSKWIKNSSIHFDNLKSGKHYFKFKIMSPLGIVYGDEYDYEVEIETSIYYRFDFLIPLVLLVLLIIGLVSYFIYKRQIYIKRVEKINQDLQRNEQLYKSVFEKASDGILLNKNGKIQFWNRQIQKMSGYESEDLYNASLVDFIVDEHKSIVIELQRAILFNKSFPERFEIQFFKKDGSICWIDVRLVLLSKTDKDYETIVFLTDIDLRKQYEFKLKKALEKEAELSEMKSSIISTISHEYRTPLTIVQTSVDLLKLYFKSQDEQKFEKYINRINSSIDRMIAFLEDIMFLGKVESKNYDLITENLELQRFCHDVINNVLANNNSNRIIHNDLNEKFIFNTDRTLLHTILYRVLDNAIKHSGEGSEIYLKCNSNDDYIIFEIIDNGKGIEQEKLDFIYDPFHRINEGDQKKGTGFGLTIVKACVEILHGEINITSKPNEGTKVLIKLPKIINY